MSRVTTSTATGKLPPITLQLSDDKQDPAYSENFYIEYTIASYLKAGVPPEKLILGVPTYGYGWTGVPAINNGLYQTSTGLAIPPSTDYLATPGVATYLTISNLTGYTRHFDYKRIAVWKYDPSSGTFWTYDDPTTVWLKMGYVNFRAPGGLGGAYVWPSKTTTPTAPSSKPSPPASTNQ